MNTPAALASTFDRLARRQTRPYRSARGGHAPGHVRDRFIDLVELYVRTPSMAATDTQKLKELTGTLWNCTDTVPWHLRADVEMLQGANETTPSTYAQCARIIRVHMKDAAQEAGK